MIRTCYDAIAIFSLTSWHLVACEDGKNCVLSTSECIDVDVTDPLAWVRMVPLSLYNLVLMYALEI